MSRDLRRRDRRMFFMSTVVLPLCLTLAACGGGGSVGVASIPPPPSTPTPTPTAATPTPTPAQAPAADAYPVSRGGNYDLIGRLTVDPGTGVPGDWTNRTLGAGEFSMMVGNGGSSYTLNGPASALPGGASSISASPIASWSINPNGYLRGLFNEAPPFAAGTNDGVGLYVDPGYSYVSMGYWGWPTILTANPSNATNFGQVLFVSGDRTLPSDIPASGTATYDAHTLLMLSSSGSPGIPFTLNADFGLRTIGTRIDQDFKNFGPSDGDPMDTDPIQGIHVSGSAPFRNDGSFDIPLSGTVNYSYENMPAPPPSQAATGDMNGAFFGPQAEQIGGTFFLQRSGDQLPLYQDAFVGQQRKP